MKLETKALCAGGLIRALGITWRLQWEGSDRLQAARRQSPGGNVIFAFWHNSLAILAWTHRNRGAQVLVSHHEDGEIIARIVASLGFGLVRGSSRRGGVEALFQLGKQLDAQRDVAVTVDGPLGPRYSVHPGVLLLARRSGRPIVPVIVTARHRQILGTWDALRIPHPGSRVILHYADPVWIPSDASKEELEAQRQKLLQGMHARTRAQESKSGHEASLRDVQDHRGVWERCSAGANPPTLLRGLAQVYGVGARADRWIRRRPRGRGSRPWVIGIGNLEAGGTGKTPVLVHIVGHLVQRGVRVAVLTRGHGGELGSAQPIRVQPGVIPTSAADETRLMRAALAPEVPLIVSRNKSHGFLHAGRDTAIDVLVVDDAFQSAGVPVDRHLVLLDAQRPLGNGYLLPAGRLRESSAALCRADLLLFTRSTSSEPPSHRQWQQRPDDCFLARSLPGDLSRIDGSLVQPEVLRGGAVATLCGIGKPEAFEDAVRQLGLTCGFEVRRSVRVADHGSLYKRLAKLVERLAALQCSHVLLTRKDACRLLDWNDNEPLLVVEQRLVIEAIDNLLQRLLPPGDQSAKSAISTVVDA